MVSVLLVVLATILAGAMTALLFYIARIHGQYDHLPGPPRPSFIFGHTRVLLDEFQKDNTGFGIVSTYFHMYGRLFVLWFGTKPLILVTDADTIRETVLSGGHPKISNNPISSFYGTKFCGPHSIITNPGDGKWRSNRRAYNKYFSRTYLKRYHGIVSLVTERMVEQLLPLCGGETEVDMNYWINLAACDVIGLSAFNWDIDAVSQRDSRFAECLEVSFKGVATSVGRPLSRFLPTYANIRKNSRNAVKELRAACQEQIRGFVQTRNRQTLEQVCKDSCIMDEILAQSPHDADFQVDEMMAFFIAGQETVAHVLTFALSHIMRDASLVRMCEDEVDRYISEPSFERLPVLEKMEHIMKETLRLYAPVPGLRRVLSIPCIIRGYHVPKGATLVHLLYLYAHDEEIWGSNHMKFYPKRFDASNFSISRKLSTSKLETTVHSERNRHPHAFLPFGIGPRTCIGREVAKVEFKVMLSNLLKYFTFKPLPDEDVEQMRYTSVKPKSGFRCFLYRNT